MSPIPIATFSISLLLLFTFLRKGTDLFSPGRLFAIIWLVAFGLAELKLSRFQIKWSLYSWFVLVVPVLSFLLGVFIIYVINIRSKIKSINSIRSKFKIDQININYLFTIILVLFALYIISYSITYMIRGFVPMFTKMPEVARTKWGVFGYGTFVLAIPTILYLSLLYLSLVNKNIGKKIIVFSIVLIAAISYSFLLNRFYLVLPIILLVITLYYKTFKLRPRNMIVLFVLFLIVFFGISTIRLSRYAINILYYLSDMKYGVEYAIFTEPYMYVTMNLENFANAVHKLDVFTYGYFTSDFILFPLGLKKTLFEYMRIDDFPYIITSAYNTYTMFFIYYRDFGLYGVLFLPLFLGAGIGTIYHRMRKNPTITNVSIYGLCVFVFVFSFFVPILHWIHFVFNIVLIYITTYMISYKTKNA